MTINDFIAKYGTHTVSITLRQLAEQLHDTRDAHGYDVNLAVVEEMAKGLEHALTAHHLLGTLSARRGSSSSGT